MLIPSTSQKSNETSFMNKIYRGKQNFFFPSFWPISIKMAKYGIIENLVEGHACRKDVPTEYEITVF